MQNGGVIFRISDNHNARVPDIIKNSIIYDLGYSAGGAFDSTGFNLSRQSNPDFASFYAANESKALSDLKSFLQSYAKIG